MKPYIHIEKLSKNFGKVRHSLVKELPLGWKQKLAFSIAIFHKPKIVFLDEPTGGVDPAVRRQFWELIYMEILLASPINPFQIILAKMNPTSPLLVSIY